MSEPSDALLLQARSLINQAVAEAAVRGSDHIRELYFVLYDAEDVAPETIRAAIETMRLATPAAAAELHFRKAPSHFVCWNCCGLRYEAADGVCPNCGHEGLIIPSDMVMSLEKIEV